MTTSYSGVGMAENAAAHVTHALDHIGLDVDLQLYSATEANDVCHQFLEAKHVFGDLLERADKKIWQHLRDMQAGILATVTADSNGMRGKRKTAAWTDACNAFLSQAAAYLDSQAPAFRPKAYCRRCHQHCQWFPDCPPGTLWLDIGGNTCAHRSPRVADASSGWIRRTWHCSLGATR